MPPLKLQQEVVEWVERQLGDAGQARERLICARSKLDELRRSVISRELGWHENRPEWELVKPGALVRDEPNALAIGPFGSNLKVSDYHEEGVPLVFVRNIRQDRFPGLQPKFVSPQKAAELAGHRVVAGDVLVTKMGDPPGDATVYPSTAPPAVITADCVRLAVDAALAQPRLVARLFETDFVRAQIADCARGVAQQKITLQSFKTLDLPIPPRRTHEALLEQLDRQLCGIESFRTTVDRALAFSTDLRAALLSHAFHGLLADKERGKSSVARLHSRRAVLVEA